VSLFDLSGSDRGGAPRIEDAAERTMIAHMWIIAAVIFAGTLAFAAANGYWIYVSITATTILVIGGLHLALKYQTVIGCLLAAVMVTAGMLALCMAIVLGPVDDLYEIALGGLATVALLGLWARTQMSN
jgi:hypothetical protein